MPSKPSRSTKRQSMKKRKIDLQARWKTTSTRVVYKNPYMRIKKDMVTRSNGLTKPFYVLDRNGPFSIIIPVKNKNTTYIVGQYRYAAKYYSWEFPMGYVRKKTLLEMAKIELKQEVGLTASKWKKIGDFFVANGHSSQQSHVFIAQDLRQGYPEPEEGEFLTVRKIKFRELEKMISEKIILDGPTITAYYLYRDFISGEKI